MRGADYSRRYEKGRTTGRGWAYEHSDKSHRGRGHRVSDDGSGSLFAGGDAPLAGRLGLSGSADHFKPAHRLMAPQIRSGARYGEIAVPAPAILGQSVCRYGVRLISLLVDPDAA